MLGGDATDYVLAEMFGRPPSEIRALPHTDIVEMRSYLTVKHEMEKLYSGRPQR